MEKLILLLCTFCSQQLISQTIIVDSDTTELPAGNLQFLRDSSGDLSFEEIREKIKNQDMVDPGSVLIEGGVKAYWIKFSVRNEADLDEEWVFDFQNWSYVDFYYGSDDSQFKFSKTGHLLPYRERSYGIANHSFISLTLIAKEEVVCYVRLDPKFNNVLQPVDLKFRLLKKQKISNEILSSLKWTYLFVGVYLVMFFYNLFISLVTRDSVFRFYLISLVILILNTLDTSGVIFDLFPGFRMLPQVLNIWHCIEPHFLTIALLLYAKDFLKIKDRYPWWGKVIDYSVYALLVMAGIILIDFKIGLPLIVLNTLPFIVIMFTVGIKSYRDSFAGSLYFIIGHAFWFLGGTATMLAQLGILPKIDFFLIHAFPLGSSLEMVLFSLALANTINFLRAENERKQKVLIDQLQKNQELQTKVNRELEEKVAERTKEINRQKEEITAERTKVELERNRSDRLLLNILPKEIADELKQTGHATPRLYEEVSIVFVDIIGFSKMVSDMSPVDLVKDLDYCFTAFDYMVTQNNLEKIKTIGDAYLCVGGLPVENKTHAKDAISVAMEMLRFMQNWEYDNPVLGHEGLNLRIGVHTGSVIAGVVGKKKFQYDIWGDAVNLASRMESNGAPGKINISQTTYDLVKDSFDCHHRGKFSVKNMGEVDMYFVEGRK